MRNTEIKSQTEDNEQENSSENIENEKLEEIEKMGSVTTVGGKHTIHCLTVVGQIEGHFCLSIKV